MTNLNSIENLLIKQSCRFFAYKFEMGPIQTDDPADIYSLKFLKLLYDKPDEHINKLLCCPSLLNDIDKKHETVDNDNLTITNKLILLNYLKKVNDMRSIPAKLWADLQHYLCYMYRYCMTTNPEPEQEILSQSFLSEVRTLICGLMQDDEIQLCLRLFSLVREYTIFAHAQHQKIPTVEASIESLFYYYEAFLSATKNICRIFPELEKLLLNTYKLGWLDFNSSIFMYYFYETPYVQNMVKQFELMKDNVSIKAAGIYTVLTELHKLWRSQMLGINGIITSKIGTKFRNSDNKSMAAYKKILSTNFWIDRTQEEKSQHDTKLFDYQLFMLVGDKNLILPEPTLDENGHCICEDCLVIKYTSLLKNQEIKLPIERMRVSCQFCKEIIDLDHFILHVNGRYSSKMDTNKCENSSNLGKSLQDNNDSVKLGMTPNSRNVNKNEDNNDDDNRVNNVKNPSPKLASEPPMCTSIQQNGDKKAQDNNAKMSRKTFINLLKHSENVEKATGPNPCNNSNKNSGVTFPCGHSCKLEEELKSEFKKAYQETCDHHKESKKCDCTFCEVFGTSSHIHKTNETRNRLRIRLNQRNEKIDNKTTDKTNPKTNVSQQNKNSTNKTESTVVTTSKIRNQSPEIFQPISFDSEPVHPITNDIHRLLSFIEGNLTTDKVALAEKKAAKKARQRLRKEQEKLKLEEEEKKRAEEEKRKQEERLRNEELEKQQAEKASKKELKKKKQKLKKETNNELIEEIIPAIVTIKRVIENDNSTPTVTITLKGSTPDQDKLLYTLVKGDNDENSSNNSSSNNNYNNTISDKKNKKTKSQSSERTISLELNCNNSNKKISGNNENVINNNNTNNNSNSSNNNNNNNSSSCGKKKKNKSDINCQSPKNIITKEVKVTLAVDSCNINNDDDKKSKAAVLNSAKIETNTKSKKQGDKKIKKNKESDINIPMLKLPPGITITKVDGPMSERNYKTTNNENHSFNSNIPVNKSGVILVDTEKLIKQSGLTSSSSSSKSTINSLTQSHTKKNKKKKNKKQETINQTNNKTEKQMVTLKNPIFQNIQTKRNDKDVIQDTNNGNCQQAAIFKNENGMVTIRSSRLQQSLTNGTPVTNFVSDLKPVLGPDVATPYMSTCNLSDTTTKISSFNAQEILSGLPGIEITKVDKHSNKIDNDNKKSCQTAEVSIIPANNNNNINNYVDKFNFDKDDLLYDNVFTPKDILEDDMDAEELELEAFKRFCQQSIPPKRKEKVAHLNVKDIVLKKKNDKISG